MNKIGSYHSTTPVRCGEAFYTIPRKEHGHTPQYALVYIHEGLATYTDSIHSALTVTAGMAFQRFPETPHTIEYIAETRSFYIAVPAEVYIMMRQQNMPTLKDPILSPGSLFDFVAHHRRLQKQLQNEAPQLMMRTLTALQELIIETHIRCVRTKSAVNDTMIRACTMLAQDHSEELNLETIAVKLGMSYSLFRREFKKATGISPGMFRIQKRLQRAQQMLQLGQRISDIALKLGYGDVYSFSAQFKKICGCSPSSYRKNFYP